MMTSWIVCDLIFKVCIIALIYGVYWKIWKVQSKLEQWERGCAVESCSSSGPSISLAQYRN